MAEFVTPDGCRLRYRLRGESGTLIALTPGGRTPGESVAALAEALAPSARVLTWDRRNTGSSDVFFGGEGSEQEIWADDLADLVAALGLGPAWLAGGSAGCRVSVLTALRRPEAARGLILWSASGGRYGCQYLGFHYHVPYIMAAQGGDMPAVARTPFFAERIRDNPDNEARLLAIDPQAFIATLKRWNDFFYYREDCTLAGVPDAALAAIERPTLVFEGGDDVHTKDVSDALLSLIPGAVPAPTPWTPQAWIDRWTGRVAGPLFAQYPLLAPTIVDFIARHPA